MSPASDLEKNTSLVLGHFEDFVNNNDLEIRIEIKLLAMKISDAA